MSTSAHPYLALDAGQTGTKARWSGGDALLPGVRTHLPLLPQLAESIRTLAADTRESFESVGIGVSGLTRADHDAAALRALVDLPASTRILLAHDSVTSYLGALGDRRGSVVAAGTGVVTLGVGRTAVSRVDGWGNIMGDAGSGYWIGREALDAVMRAYDGRGPETALSAVVRETWPDLEEAYILLQSSPDRIRTVAGFARAVATLADTDAVAHDICVAAARELAHSVDASLRRVSDPENPDEEFLVSAVGGVFSGDLVARTFADLIRTARPGVVLEEAHGTGLDGAASLAALPDGHPLLGLVSVSDPR